MQRIILIFSLLMIFTTACKKEKITTDNAAKIILKFQHKVDGMPLVTDTMIYVNEAGNPYEVNEIQYFISDVVLYKSDGTQKAINQWQDIYYVDIDIPSTLSWAVYDSIQAGDYDSISFTFGINEQKNQSYMYVNPPESFMFWPTILGGGYHYLKLNGKWKTPANDIRFYNFHLGIGQVYSGNDTTYAHNHFRVSLPASNFSIDKGLVKNINIIMNIEEWFKSPNIYDHNVWGGDIMENQNAMVAGKENGWNVFSVNFD